jgi:5-formyltetrahydrofolate cyclo-ligase
MREKMSENETRRKTQRIAERFFQQDELLNAQNILIYASNNKGEVYTRRIIDMLIGMGNRIF